MVTELKIQDGDYVPDGRGGFVTVSGSEEFLQRVMYKLKAPRGALALMEDFGSTLRGCMRMKSSVRSSAVKAAVLQALRDEENMTIDDIALTYGDGDTLLLDMHITYSGEKLDVTLEVENNENN